MLFQFDGTTDQPAYQGRIDDGWLAVQVINGAGVWVGKTSNRLKTNQGPGTFDLYDGFLVLPSDGVVKIPWSGDIYLFWPDRLVEVYGVIDYVGCQD